MFLKNKPSFHSLKKKNHITVKVISKNNLVVCHASSAEAALVDEYLMFWNKNIRYKSLYAYMKNNFHSVDHVFLSAYLKSKGYSSGYVEVSTGTKLKLWNKLVK
jgi:hypothetical protein